LRVLYVNHTGLVSGAERSLLDLLARLPSDLEPTVACPPGPLADAVTGTGIMHQPIQGTAAGFRSGPRNIVAAGRDLALMARDVRRLASAIDADVLHANSVRAGLATLISQIGAGRPIVVHVRDFLPHNAVANRIRRFVNARAAAVVAISRAIERDFQITGHGGNLVVILDPVDLTAFANEPPGAGRAVREALSIPVDAPVLTVVGQLTPWKGQDDAVRILSLVRDSGLAAHLLVVGEAKFVSRGTSFDNVAYQRSLLELAGDLGVQDAVHFLGERGDVPSLLRATDIALVPSWKEPFGRTVVEAMAAGVAVIATSSGGPSEMISDGDDGILLPPREPHVWADAAGALLASDGRRAELGASARERALGTFSGSEQVDSLLALYRAAVA